VPNERGFADFGPKIGETAWILSSRWVKLPHPTWNLKKMGVILPLLGPLDETTIRRAVFADFEVYVEKGGYGLDLS